MTRLFCLFVLCLPGCQSAQGTARLGRRSVDILSAATKVEVFRLDGRRQPGDWQPKPGETSLCGFPITARGPDQGEAFARKLADLLLDERTHTRETAACFLPGIGFRVWRGEDSVDVLICFLCDNFYCGPTRPAARETASFLGSPQRPLLVRLAKEAFPDDKDIQGLAESRDPTPAR
jgi:hypothetical protein